jgi:2-isopropylmalate synthase
MTRIEIYDTTLRDGSQGEGVNFSLEDKLLITRKLDELGIDYVEGGYPLSNPKDEEYFARVRELPLSHVQVAAFGMTRRRGIAADADIGMQRLVESNAPIITIVGKSWDLHVSDVLRVTRDENLAMIHDSVAFCRSAKRRAFYDAEHFFDGFKHNPEFALETILGARDAGAEVIILCDTNGGSLPDEVAEAVQAALEAVDGGVPIGIHCHNDCDLAVANTLAAIRRGATHVQGTINGIGERCGNVDLCSVIANLSLKNREYQVLEPDRLVHLTEVSRFVYETANMNFRPNQPFVGTSAFAHKGGMHAHAVARRSDTYEHIDPARVGNQRRILISELSGQSNILAKTARHKIESDRELNQKILQRVNELENEGYQFEAAEASFDLMVLKMIGAYQPWFNRLHYRVNVETEGDPASGANRPLTEATVKLSVQDKIEHTVSEGDGPVNALDSALRKALEPHYPKLAEMQLVDYKVRVINERAGTAARVRVVIESRDPRHIWGTVGVSENIIEASWLALVDSIEYKLWKDRESGERGA